MTRRRQIHDVDWLIAQVDAKLRAFGVERSGLELRDKVTRLVDVLGDVRDLGVSTVAEYGWDAGGARERIRLYFLEYVGTKISGSELEVVAGISEFGRRIRELRVERGYQVATGASPDPESGITLASDEYLLVQAEPDIDLARRWHIANRIRRSTGAARDRVLQFLRENVRQVVTTEELAYVAKSREFGRRTRELRTEDGWQVATRFTGRPDLASGQYVLQSATRIAEPHDRHISEAVQRDVYERDKNACRICGWTIQRWTQDDPRILELHHIDHHVIGGANARHNLVVLCSRCHDELHAGRVNFPPDFRVE